MLVKILETCRSQAGFDQKGLRPSMSKVEKLLHDFEANAGDDYKDAFVRMEKSKGEFLLRQGEISSELFFIEKGIARLFSYHNGKEITTDFFFSSEFAGVYDSVVLKSPSIFSIQTLTDSAIYVIRRQRLKELAMTYPALIDIERTILSCYITDLQIRMLDMLSLSAAERYEHLLDTHPNIVKYLPANYISSYLGVAPETLSRIRREQLKH